MGYNQPDEPLFSTAISKYGFSSDVPRRSLLAHSPKREAKLSELPIEPLAERYRYMSEASDALAHAQEVADYQAIGVRWPRSVARLH